MDHRKDHFSKIRDCVLSINGALLCILHRPGWDRELVRPIAQRVPSTLIRCGMTNEGLLPHQTPLQSSQAYQGQIPESRYHYDEQKHQDTEKIRGYAQKRSLLVSEASSAQ